MEFVEFFPFYEVPHRGISTKNQCSQYISVKALDEQVQKNTSFYMVRDVGVVL